MIKKDVRSCAINPLAIHRLRIEGNHIPIHGQEVALHHEKLSTESMFEKPNK